MHKMPQSIPSHGNCEQCGFEFYFCPQRSAEGIEYWKQQANMPFTTSYSIHDLDQVCISLQSRLNISRKLLRQETQDSAFSEETPRSKVRGALSRHDNILLIVFGLFAHVVVVFVVVIVVVSLSLSSVLLIMIMLLSRQETSESEEPPIHNKSKHCRLQLPE